ncbi:hypothetical protein [Halomontanus rarus]|uniref:hypothetical protein n=1 Tax=Halomontanus rarus TaxID=3034020 RepID=UPI0023E89E34|nr:hypothetical protein [Halovivax sp. TS33]
MHTLTHRVARLFVAALLITTVLGAAVPAATANTTPTDAPIEPSIQEANNSTTDDDQLETDPEPDGPTDASQVRLTPDIPDADYVGIETRESDETYNTSGTFATFTLSRPVESVRVNEPGASASMVGDGSVVRIEYESDAAPRDMSSLFTLELFFADDSTKTVDLYATNTDVSANTRIDPAYEDFIEYVQGQAESADYATDPDGLQSYVEYKEERATLLEGLWSEQIQTFIALRMAQAFSPLDWVALIGVVALLSLFASRKHGWVLRAQQIATSKAELVREAVRQDYEQQRNAAAKHALEDIEGIGRNDSRYWRNVGIETVDDMIQIACKGIVAVDDDGHIEQDDDGNDVFAHHGIDDLRKVDPITEKALREKTWLKPLIIEGRLRATTALSNIERALLTAEREYSRGNEVREARMQVQEMIAELRGEREFADAKTSTYGARELPRANDRPEGPTGTGAD